MWIVSALQDSHVFLYLSVAALGLAVGSFLNVVIVRLPTMLQRSWQQQCREFLELESGTDADASINLAHPASHCPACGHPIRPLHNIPVLSYLWLRGRCAHCGARISPRYPAVEILAAAIAVLAASRFGLSWELAGALALGWSFLAMSAIDIEHHLLPDGIVLPLLWLGLAANALGGSTGLYTDLHSALYGALAGYLSLWVVFQSFRVLTGKEGMGYGDFKLFACIGAWLGWQSLALVILLAAVSGSLAGIAMIAVSGRDRSQPIPFGPFLCVAGFVALLWGPQLTEAYLQFAGL